MTDNIPSHVPPERVVDFDYFSPPGYQQDFHAAWKRIQDTAPRIFWTPRHGGHWVATRAAEIAEIDKLGHEIFSHSGISIPRSKLPSLPLECDPPQHTGLRSIISPLFAPPTLVKAEAHLRSLLLTLMNDLAPAGRCEFMGDFANKIPISIFLNLVDLPMEDGPYLCKLAAIRVREANVEKRDAAKKGVQEYLASAVNERRVHPRDDLLSRIIHGKINGAPPSEDELQNMLATIMFGGLDTVVASMGYIFRFLAGDQASRHWLVRQTRIPMSAVDELFRRHGIVSTARLVMRDTEFGGLTMKAGEQILVPTFFVGLDDERFANPMQVDFERSDSAQGGTFGSGPHRCPGMNLGRMEVRFVLEEWLKRIPDFSLEEGFIPVIAPGIASGIVSMPLTWPVH